MRSALDATKGHDVAQKTALGYVNAETNGKIIKEIEKAFYGLLVVFYPALKNMSKRLDGPNAPSLWIGMIDFILHHLFGEREKDENDNVRWDNFLGSVGTGVWDEIELMDKLAARGVHESRWPTMTNIEALLPGFNFHGPQNDT